MFIPLYDENPTRRTPLVTVTIIVINVLALLYTQSIGRTQGALAQNAFVTQHGFIPARLGQLVHRQPLRIDLTPTIRLPDGRQLLRAQRAVLPLPPSATQIALSAFTAMFLHGNWYHLISNMWFFWIFGNNIEDRLGHGRFLAFYLAGGLIATGCHAIMSTGQGALVPVIGASGAVAATLGAYAIFYPWTNVRTLLFIVVFFTLIDVPALLVLGFWFVTQLISGIDQLRFPVGVGVAWWAHIGGFIAGAALMPLIAPRDSGEPLLAWRREKTIDERMRDPW